MASYIFGRSNKVFRIKQERVKFFIETREMSVCFSENFQGLREDIHEKLLPIGDANNRNQQVKR